MRFYRYILFLLFTVVSVCSAYSNTNLRIEKGILDLRGLSIDEISEIPLSGDWEFYWDELLISSDFKSANKPNRKFISVPSVWSTFKHEGKNIPAIGFATYRMRVLVDSTENDLSLKIGGIGTAYKLFINGKVIAKAGIVASTKTDSKPGYNPGVFRIKNPTDTIEVIFQVSNYDYARSGLWDDFNQIGNTASIKQSWNRDIQLSLLLIGCMLIFALYHLFLYFINTKFQFTLTFSIFCILIVLRTAVINEIYILDLFPDFNWILLIKIEYLTLTLGTIAFSLFIYRFYIEEYAYSFLKIIVISSIIQSLIIAFTQPAFFTQYLYIFQINLVIAATYILFTVIKALKNKKQSAFIILIGFSILMLAIVNDILHTNKVIDSVLVTSFGFIIFIFSQSIMLSVRFSVLFRRTETLAQRLETTNINLEKLVEKRTLEVQKQNEQLIRQSDEITQKNNSLENQNEEIKQQRDYLEKQNITVHEQKQQITSSIEYAQRIQSAVIDTSNEIKQVAPNNFILFKPKDIVSGDFYWFKEVTIDNKKHKLIALVDCTGHGVPGAFMSILGALILDKIILNFDKTPKASEILNQMRLEVKYLLQQNVDKIAVKDGMDMSLIIINYDTMQMQFAGAQNNIYLIRHNKGTYDDKIEEHKGDHMPIGIYVKEKESFTNHIISINKNDLVYLFSDGYYDQFGGKESKKFKKINFKKTLLKGAPLPLDEQKNNLEQTINKWQGDYEQIDDITVIGLKI